MLRPARRAITVGVRAHAQQFVGRWPYRFAGTFSDLMKFSASVSNESLL